MIIYINYGSYKILEIETYTHDTVQQLRNKLIDRYPHLFNENVILHKYLGGNMENNKTLTEYNIGCGDTIHAIYRYFPRDTQCCICLEDIGLNEGSTLSNCDHVFHESCVAKLHKPECPKCRVYTPTLNKE